MVDRNFDKVWDMITKDIDRASKAEEEKERKRRRAEEQVDKQISDSVVKPIGKEIEKCLRTWARGQMDEELDAVRKTFFIRGEYRSELTDVVVMAKWGSSSINYNITGVESLLGWEMKGCRYSYREEKFHGATIGDMLRRYAKEKFVRLGMDGYPDFHPYIESDKVEHYVLGARNAIYLEGKPFLGVALGRFRYRDPNNDWFVGQSKRYGLIIELKRIPQPDNLACLSSIMRRSELPSITPDSVHKRFFDFFIKNRSNL